MTISPVAFTTLDSNPDWARVKQHMILNGQDLISLTVDDIDRLLQSHETDAMARLDDRIQELESINSNLEAMISKALAALDH